MARSISATSGSFVRHFLLSDFLVCSYCFILYGIEYNEE